LFGIHHSTIFKLNKKQKLARPEVIGAPKTMIAFSADHDLKTNKRKKGGNFVIRQPSGRGKTWRK